MIQKTFLGDLFYIHEMLKDKYPFSFTRFSDGELYLMQNRSITINDTQVIVGDTIYPRGYSSIDHKHVDLSKNPEVRTKLLAALKHTNNNYYKGLSCRCCVGEDNFKWMINNSENGPYTWANLFVNSNYPYFLNQVLPTILKHPIILVCNESAKINTNIINVVKRFNVGSNCIINNADMPNEIASYIADNNIQNHIILCSASSLSAFIIHKLNQVDNKNTHLNVGTTINHLIGLPLNRDYHEVLNGVKNTWNQRTCIW